MHHQSCGNGRGLGSIPRVILLSSFVYNISRICEALTLCLNTIPIYNRMESGVPNAEYEGDQVCGGCSIKILIVGMGLGVVVVMILNCLIVYIQMSVNFDHPG